MFRSSAVATSKKLASAFVCRRLTQQALRSFSVMSGTTTMHSNNMLSSHKSSTFNRIQQVKFYSDAPPLTRDIVKERVIDLLKSYSKTNKDASIEESSSFSKDLGLDSFDVVEVVMEIEYEFSIIIPDDDADEIKTVGQAIDYVTKQPDAC